MIFRKILPVVKMHPTQSQMAPPAIRRRVVQPEKDAYSSNRYIITIGTEAYKKEHGLRKRVTLLFSEEKNRPMLKRILIGVGLMFTTIELVRRYLAIPPITRAEAADMIDHMINGTVSSAEWDDFLHLDSDKEVEPVIRMIAIECSLIYSRYPAGPDGGYCNADGFRRLSELRDILRAGRDYPN
jgi:hypothetical protein